MEPKGTAPEILRQGEITSKSDVFSFAICMWEILERGSRKTTISSQFLIPDLISQNHGLKKQMLKLLMQ